MNLFVWLFDKWACVSGCCIGVFVCLSKQVLCLILAYVGLWIRLVVGEVLIFVSDCEIRGFDCLIVGEVGLC